MPQHFRCSFEQTIHLFRMETFGEVFTKFQVLFKTRMCSAQFCVYGAWSSKITYPRVQLDIFSTKPVDRRSIQKYREVITWSMRVQRCE